MFSKNKKIKIKKNIYGFIASIFCFSSSQQQPQEGRGVCCGAKNFIPFCKTLKKKNAIEWSLKHTVSSKETLCEFHSLEKKRKKKTLYHTIQIKYIHNRLSFHINIISMRHRLINFISLFLTVFFFRGDRNCCCLFVILLFLCFVCLFVCFPMHSHPKFLFFSCMCSHPYILTSFFLCYFVVPVTHTTHTFSL